MDYSKNQQLILLEALYGIALSSMGIRNDSARQAMLNPDLQVYFKEIPNLKDALREASRGKNIELYPIGAGLKMFVVDLGISNSLNPKVFELIKAFGLYFRAGSTGAWRKIEVASASPVFPPWIRSSFTKRVGDQAQVNQALKAAVRALTGKPGLGIDDLEKAAEAKRRSPETYKEYLKLRRQFNEIWKSELSNFVRSSGETLVNMTDVEKHFKEIGMEHSMPSGFTGKIDALGMWYDHEGRRLNGVPSVVMFPTVKMNPKSSTEGEWVFQGVRKDGAAGNYFYAVEDIRKRKSEKFGKVSDLSEVIDHIRSRWTQGINHFSEEHKETVAAVVLELLYQFSARIGSSGNQAAGKATFGLGTVLAKHVTLDDNGFVINYLGKDGVRTRHKFMASDPLSKRIVSAVKSLMDGKSPKEPLFTWKTPSGVRKPVPPGLVNKVFHTLGAPEGVTVHKLRSLKGTAIFNEEFDKLKARKVQIRSPSEALNILKSIATKVGKELNHVRRGIDGGVKATGATALAAYIDVNAQIDFFEYFGLPLPTYLSRMSGRSELTAASVTSASEDGENPTPAPGEEPTAPEKENPEPEQKPDGQTTEKESTDPVKPKSKPAEKPSDDTEPALPDDEDVPDISADLLESILTAPDETVEEVFYIQDL